MTAFTSASISFVRLLGSVVGEASLSNEVKILGDGFCS